MDIDNLLSGLIGALAAVILTHLYSNFQDRNRILKIKKSILSYHKLTVIPKINIYIENTKNAIDEVKHAGQYTARNRIYDEMPMLSIQFYRGYSSQELYRAVGNDKYFIKLIDISHTIDFLKSNMPLRIVNDFTQKFDLHLKSESILNISSHITECEYCKDQIIRYSENLNLKIATATELLDEINELNSNL